MKRHILKTVCVGIAGVACITLITFAEDPPPIPPSAPHFLWTSAVWQPGTYFGNWDDEELWTFYGPLVPVINYPTLPSQDAIVQWATSPMEPQTHLLVYLTDETIDDLTLRVDPEGEWDNVYFKFASKGCTGKTLYCDTVTIKENVTFRLTDDAGVVTVDY